LPGQRKAQSARRREFCQEKLDSLPNELTARKAAGHGKRRFFGPTRGEGNNPLLYDNKAFADFHLELSPDSRSLTLAGNSHSRQRKLVDMPWL
jgi:hypothetical protein